MIFQDEHINPVHLANPVKDNFLAFVTVMRENLSRFARNWNPLPDEFLRFTAHNRAHVAGL